MAAWTNAWNALTHPNTGRVGRNLTPSLMCAVIRVALPCLCSGSTTGWTPAQRGLPTVHSRTASRWWPVLQREQKDVTTPLSEPEIRSLLGAVFWFVCFKIYFELQMGFNPMAVSLRRYNTQVHMSHTDQIHISYTHQIHISHKVTPLKHTNKQKISSQSYTSSNGHITVTGYSVEKQLWDIETLTLSG
jgi:hypothetical protein